ncbi:Histidine kinase [Catalinimonas alkaloidigena]|uniref:Histidine kinase n=1 Tax=Catalinimonas alkaloidigena TaxID=1075417 RepID=A0A1G9N9R3_9BACT|nr:histidine kinase [Catalinimonas alkaloidigena]SDL83219.1 Histidine kinase [Catalinimonas alkaloidigena]
MKTLAREQVYWICQIVGWSAYGLISLFISYFAASGEEAPALQIQEILSSLMVVILGIGHTHFFRHLLKRWGWTQLSLDQLIVRVLIADVVMAVSLVFIMFMIDLILGLVPLPLRNIDLGSLLLSLPGFSLTFFMWSLMYFAITSFRNYKREEIERLKWERSIKDFELNKLKSQMNPHFVFNALNSIRALVEEDPEKAKSSITQLSNILRNSLIAGRSKTISLEEEMRTVNDYLLLEKLRFEERLDVNIHLAPEALQIRVPPMIVQTLAENAVKHGISKKTEGGFIEIAGHMENNCLQLSIRNTGVLKSLNSGGFGILNTKQRLELLYGSEDYFTITQESPDVVHVNLKIPC